MSLIFDKIPKSFKNSFVLQEQHHFGDLVRFQCNFGYVIAGPSALICTSSGAWNGTIPECQCK